MVDVISISRICCVLPNHVRLVLVGDPHQLMPVGPGLVLHALSGVPAVSVVELLALDRGNSQVLDAVGNGPVGTKTLNALCQERFTAGAAEVKC